LEGQIGGETLVGEDWRGKKCPAAGKLSLKMEEGNKETSSIIKGKGQGTYRLWKVTWARKRRRKQNPKSLFGSGRVAATLARKGK